jgi:hypothetical protein
MGVLGWGCSPGAVAVSGRYRVPVKLLWHTLEHDRWRPVEAASQDA